MLNMDQRQGPPNALLILDERPVVLLRNSTHTLVQAMAKKKEIHGQGTKPRTPKRLRYVQTTNIVDHSQHKKAQGAYTKEQPKSRKKRDEIRCLVTC